MEGYGFIRKEMDIKILILFILEQLPAPVSSNMLLELTMCDDAINYFRYTQCLAELERTGHLVLLDGERYIITDRGRQLARDMGGDLPYTVRMKAGENAHRAAKILNREAMITTTHTPKADGSMTVRLGLADGLGDIMKLELLAGSEAQATTMEQHFRKHAEALYLKIAALLTEDEKPKDDTRKEAAE